MSKNMKPCPFCGSDAIYILPHRKKWKGFFAFCDHCEARGPRHATCEDAKDEWNVRSETKQKKQELPDGLPPVPEGAVYVGKGYEGILGVDFKSYYFLKSYTKNEWIHVGNRDALGSESSHYAIIPLKKQVPWDSPADVPPVCWLMRETWKVPLLVVGFDEDSECMYFSTGVVRWKELEFFRWSDRPGVPWAEMEPCTKEEQR